mgnify:CR=1 FL=1
MSCYCQTHDVVVQPDDYCLPGGDPLVIFGFRAYQHEPGSVSERGDRSPRLADVRSAAGQQDRSDGDGGDEHGRERSE